MTSLPRECDALDGGSNAPGHRVDGAQPALSRLLVGGVLALVVAMGIGRFAYTPILPAMQRATELTVGQAGLIASANYAGYLTGALLAATVTAGVRRDHVIGTCFFGVVLTTGMVVSTTTVVTWSIIRFLSGLASAGTFVLTSGLVLDVLRRQRSVSLTGWLYSGVGLGIAISGVVVRVVDGALGWRGDWLVLGLLASILSMLSWNLLFTTPAATTTAAQVRPSRQRPASAFFVLLLVAYFLEGTGYVVTGTFLVAIVESMPGLDGVGPSVWIVVGLSAAPSCVLWSLLATRIGYTSALSLAYVAQACGIALPALDDGAAIALATAVLFGGTFMGITSLTLTLAGQIARHRSTGAIGMLTAAFGLGQIVGPSLGGMFVDRVQSFGPALMATSAIVLMGGILVAALLPFDPSRRGRRSDSRRDH